MAAVALAARLFGSEDVLFGSQSAWSDLLRRPRHQRAAPTVASAMFCLAMLFPAYFLVTSGMAQLEDDTFRLQLVYAALGTPLLFAGLPLLTAWLNRDRWRASFNLHPAGPALIGGLLLGISLWPFAHELLLWQRDWNLVSFTGERLSQAKKFLEALQNLPAWAPVLVLGVLPGVCEELCFRGYVFRAMRSRLKPWGAIVASALLFGAFHVVGTGLLTVERFLPSTLLGLVLGWVCYRSGSVFPGMVLHVCHNSLVLLLAYYHPWLEQQGIQVQENLHLPPRWLAMAAGAALCGGLLVRLDRSRVE
jgi:ABC-2 type transport system permease protein/sodium transport system permease protein